MSEGRKRSEITARHNKRVTKTVELGVLVPYPEEGREANDQRRPSVLSHSRETVCRPHRHAKNTTSISIKEEQPNI
ncbi:hypothetical protein EYF80_028537 [Liparis tanakae]|uniref:Uncharacterized protein n=1 Tax=Liparis tanakae TaxID=230148 RepID=A0A4Z2H8Z9_9TELE|nr:hypothetical protein EYF80_028537 [Liparis tanakae]